MMHRESIDFGGRTLTLEVGRLAKQAHGGVWVEYGDSRVLVTACYNENSLPTGDFFPLTVDYQEKMSAVGRFPGGYIKREGRPQLRETLTSRLIDRPIRPLFSEGYRRETQIIATVFSADKENDPAIMALIGASAALTVSCIPFEGPVAGVRIALIDGAFVCNPTNEQLESARLDLIVVASEKAIVMVEGECDEVSEAEMVDALMQAFDWAQPVIEAQKRLAAAAGTPKLVVTPAAAIPRTAGASDRAGRTQAACRLRHSHQDRALRRPARRQGRAGQPHRRLGGRRQAAGRRALRNHQTRLRA